MGCRASVFLRTGQKTSADVEVPLHQVLHPDPVGDDVRAQVLILERDQLPGPSVDQAGREDAEGLVVAALVQQPASRLGAGGWQLIEP